MHCLILIHTSLPRAVHTRTSLVMTDEEYDRRKGTLRDWGWRKEEEDSSFSLKRHAREHADLVEARSLFRESGEVKTGFEVDYLATIVQPGSRRGEIVFLRPIDELGGGGHWLGVILDDPVGKTDDTVQSTGVRYFEAHGISIKDKPKDTTLLGNGFIERVHIVRGECYQLYDHGKTL